MKSRFFLPVQLFALIAVCMTVPAEAKLKINAVNLVNANQLFSDTSAHPGAYASGAWRFFVPPHPLAVGNPLEVDNSDGSVTIFFSTFEDFVVSLQSISKQRGEAVDVLNINVHGLPGQLSTPSDASDLSSDDCLRWRATVASSQETGSASAADAAVSLDKWRQIMSMSKDVADHPRRLACHVGLNELNAVLDRTSDPSPLISPDASISLVSCLVGRGEIGRAFVETLARRFLPGGEGKVVSDMEFGIADYSTPQGMGLWDFSRLEDITNKIIEGPASEIPMQGSLRIAQHLPDGSVKSTILPNQHFMKF